MKHLILQDASFVVAFHNSKDKFYEQAVEIIDALKERKDNFKVIIPSIVFFEVITKLIQRGVDPAVVRQKLWNYLYDEEVLNLTILETAAFRLSKQIVDNSIELKTSDAIIAMTGIEFEAQILTFDKGLHSALRKINYADIYLCNKDADRKRFIAKLDRIIRKK